jgi:hypothetical protein
MPLVEVLEGAIALLVKGNHNRHHFAETQSTGPAATSHAAADQPLLPLLLEDSAEVIDCAEQSF